ncbi:DUF4376 domain-containing protein [Paraburkholderia tropica]|uniref:DUF4376 domain-containing protein n=1 Tax=Paraburkholderia tropica TaxID=92647 RepID=UPI002AAF9E34|nr:DUF4376 domain-containing protein [Paraburkholderia tropica]
MSEDATQDVVTFAEMGFDSVVTASSATPATDGYFGTFNGLPYHIDPTVTPDSYAALQVAIAANEVTVNPYVAPAVTLAEAQATQQAVIVAAYENAVAQPVSYKTVGGVTQTFDADADSQTVLMQATQGYGLAGAVPSGFYWVAADNTHVTFALADLSGLYQAILAQGWEAFQKKQALKAQINAATTVADVQTIVWS